MLVGKGAQKKPEGLWSLRSPVTKKLVKWSINHSWNGREKKTLHSQFVARSTHCGATLVSKCWAFGNCKTLKYDESVSNLMYTSNTIETIKATYLWLLQWKFPGYYGKRKLNAKTKSNRQYLIYACNQKVAAYVRIWNPTIISGPR